jgi:hypothetical protein
MKLEQTPLHAVTGHSSEFALPLTFNPFLSWAKGKCESVSPGAVCSEEDVRLGRAVCGALMRDPRTQHEGMRLARKGWRSAGKGSRT